MGRSGPLPQLQEDGVPVAVAIAVAVAVAVAVGVGEAAETLTAPTIPMKQ
jgi:hypothetical protein